MTNVKTLIILVIFVILPMLICGMIYVLARPTSIILFSWLNEVGLEDFIFNIRSVINANHYINDWFLYNSPALFWSFSFTCFLGVIWSFNFDFESIGLFLIPMCLGIITEVLQEIGVIKGTFDIVDIILYIIGGLSGIFLINIINNRIKIRIT